MRISIVIAAATVASLSAVAPASAQRLTGTELAGTMVGQPLTVLSPVRGEIGQILWNTDGTGGGQFTSPSGQVVKFTGKWAVREDRFCRTLDGQGRESCFVIVMTRDGTLEQRDAYGRVALRYRAAKAPVPTAEAPAPAPAEAPPAEEEDVPQK